jgi:hypothetical protein
LTRTANISRDSKSPTNRVRRLPLRQIAWVLAALVFCAPVSAEQALTPHSAEYKVKIKIFGGVLSTQLRTTDAGYVATHEINTTGMARVFARGSIKESAEFGIAEGGVRSAHYVSNDTLTRDKTKADIQFDWEASEANGIVNGEQYESQFEGLVFDRIALQYELMRDLLNGEPGGQYVLFDVKKLRTVDVSIVGRKTISTPLGKFDAVGIQHQSQNKKSLTTMWCVEELGYLPVMIEQYRKGKLQVRATLQKYTPEET